MIVTGGETGGHTHPALTTIRTLRDRPAATGTEPDVRWVGVARGLEAGIVGRRALPSSPLRMLAGPDASANRPYEEIMVLLDHPERCQELANAARQHGPHVAAVAGAIIDDAGRCRS